MVSDSAIDIALDKNQIRSVNMMIDYMVQHQNSFVYSDLFANNFVEMYTKGCEMRNLLESNIFFHTFDYDGWPGTNVNTERRIEPYNDSVFKLRSHYQSIFPDIHEADE